MNSVGERVAASVFIAAVALSSDLRLNSAASWLIVSRPLATILDDSTTASRLPLPNALSSSAMRVVFSIASLARPFMSASAAWPRPANCSAASVAVVSIVSVI